MAKKCTKKRDAHAKLLFCQSKPNSFLPFSLPLLSSLLKLPIVRQEFIVCLPFMVFFFDTVIMLIP